MHTIKDIYDMNKQYKKNLNEKLYELIINMNL